MLDNCEVRFNIFSNVKLIDVLMRNCHIKAANYSTPKANSLTYINCTGLIEACCTYLYVFGGQYKNAIWNDAPTGAIVNIVYDKTAYSIKNASTIMTLNILDSGFDTDMLPIRHSQDITTRPDLSSVAALY